MPRSYTAASIGRAGASIFLKLADLPGEPDVEAAKPPTSVASAAAGPGSLPSEP